MSLKETRCPSFSVSTKTPSQSNKRALGRRDGAADDMHFTTPNRLPLLFLIVELANFEHDDDDADGKKVVFLGNNWIFDEDDDVVVSGGGEMAFAAIFLFFAKLWFLVEI